MTASTTCTLLLTAAPGSGVVTESVTQAALGALAGTAADVQWLSPGDAWEARFDLAGASSLAAQCDAVAQAIGPTPVDVNIVAGEPDARRKRLLVADMESTIIQQELIDEIAEIVGCRAEIAAITESAMRGEIDFETSLAQRVALLAGIEAHRLEAILAGVTLMPGAESLVATMRANGGWTALVSGGFTIFAERIAARLGFDAVVANVLEIEGGQLTGRVREPIVGPQSKANTLKRLAAEGGLPLSETLAVGDGANDVAMLAAAGLGVAFRAKPILAEQARALDTGAVVTHGDLTALLHLQGYGRNDIVVC
ncbi:phosphoserine phosphatase SerB [Hyphomicrobium sp.]|uniref:phosphoserine phosphatase SerB n=1 Tax=Hyphomicrobium sp. TaxID=82 RepID=UPI0025BC9FAE|nr:phosphoserine phosphatase SerB [Hyphomicrobium sp.]MCC7252463.1 phosphoserine phosphatase SerB [Hyphomicrobium sp.]